VVEDGVLAAGGRPGARRSLTAGVLMPARAPTAAERAVTAITGADTKKDGSEHGHQAGAGPESAGAVQPGSLSTCGLPLLT